MKQILSSFLIGLLFALGLGISGMTHPSKILGFLNILGAWDPSLLFVMAGAVLTHRLSYIWMNNRSSPLFSNSWHVPKRTDFDFKLMGGSAIFGIGWGLSGLCPGPAIVSLASGSLKILIFVSAMYVGMVLFLWISKWAKKVSQ